MRKARIAIAAGVSPEKEEVFQGYPKVMLMEAYCRSVSETGGIPFVIPPTDEEDILRSQLECCDALLLTGGADIDPVLFGEEAIPLCEEPNPRRDRFDWLCLRLAEERNMPVFGICRGLQIMNAYYGGTLWQDLSLSSSSLRHSNKYNPDYPAHEITLERDSFLARAAGKEKLKVNSVHHQAIRDVAAGFRITARANDGVAEAIESVEKPFRAAVQWHPEMMLDSREESRAIFRALIALAMAEKP